MPARTVVVNPQTPGPSLSFALPANVTMSVQAVFAAIDATGAGAVGATLEIADSSGAVIARKRQGETIDSGVIGSATWALRLTDEAAGAAAGLVKPWYLYFGFTGAGAFNSSVAADTRGLDEGTALYGSQQVSLSAAWTVAAGDSLAVGVINRTGVPLIFQCAQLSLLRADAAGASFYNGISVIVANNVTAQIPVNTLRFGPAQLNLANPLVPTVVNAGRYVANARISIRPVP